MNKIWDQRLRPFNFHISKYSSVCRILTSPWPKEHCILQHQVFALSSLKSLPAPTLFRRRDILWLKVKYVIFRIFWRFVVWRLTTHLQDKNLSSNLTELEQSTRSKNLQFDERLVQSHNLWFFLLQISRYHVVEWNQGHDLWVGGQTSNGSERSRRNYPCN